MNTEDLRSSIIMGCAVALVASLPMIFFIGIGGALVSAIAGAVISSVTSVAVSHATQKAREELMARTQIEGVLDSSQLDGTAPSLEDAAPFGGHGKVVAVALSLVASLASGAIVGAATGGAGINFYLGGSQPSTSQKTPEKDADKTATQADNASTQGSVDTDDDVEVTTTWYPSPADDEDQATNEAPADDNSAQVQEPQEPADVAPTDEQPTQDGTTADQPAQDNGTIVDESATE